MPIYEYVCTDCNTRFEALRSMSKADATISCENCAGEKTSRVVSAAFAHSSGSVVAGRSREHIQIAVPINIREHDLVELDASRPTQIMHGPLPLISV